MEAAGLNKFLFPQYWGKGPKMTQKVFFDVF